MSRQTYVKTCWDIYVPTGYSVLHMYCFFLKKTFNSYLSEFIGLPCKMIFGVDTGNIYRNATFFLCLTEKKEGKLSWTPIKF